MNSTIRGLFIRIVKYLEPRCLNFISQLNRVQFPSQNLTSMSEQGINYYKDNHRP